MSERFKWAPYSRIREAAEELKATIRTKYPDAQFKLSRAQDDRDAWNLWTRVDREDPDEVRDLTRDRELDLLTEEGIPLYVVPTQGKARFTRQSSVQVRKIV
jgi:hypothetical protein